jgi:uncharacterized protein (TIGR02145 family)
MTKSITCLVSEFWFLLFSICLTNCESDNQNQTIDYTGQIGTVVDIDSNNYPTIGIGSQIWMAKNLATSRLNDGMGIPNIIQDSVWVKTFKPACCIYENDSLNYKNGLGLLYNFYSVKSDKLCPDGWRVPTYKDWTRLAQFVGGLDNAGGKLKQMDGFSWEGDNYGYDNAYNFNALPGGYRWMSWTLTHFMYRGSSGYWWTADSVDNTYASGVSIKNSSLTLAKEKLKKLNAASVRCIKN